MTRRIATLPSISMRPDTQSSKATIRQKDGDGAISTSSFWTYPIVQRLSSVQFHAIIDAIPSTHNREDLQMTHITYEIVEHDGGWAYRVDGVVSETFPSHDAARRAAEHAAAEQRVPGNTTGISYEDKDDRWHGELSDGHDRPITEVKG
jgi:Uncharacterized protein conserved in bacteria (DUF2188)